MKSYLLLLLSCCLAFGALAQDVDVDRKTGIVTVDGKEAFYLLTKNKGVFESDYSLQNLGHQELAYLKLVKTYEYNGRGGTNTILNYNMVFNKTGNQCLLTRFNSLSIIKPLARMIAGANLVQDGKISEEEERKFIVMNNGTFLKNPNERPQQDRVVVVNNDNTPRSSGPADISLKENKIYNNSELVGIFKRTVENNITTISIYNTTDALICRANHPNNNDNADWDIQVDGKAITLLYNPASPLEKLFKYLVEKGYL